MMPHKIGAAPSHEAQPKQQGVVLIVVLVMLVAIAFLSISVMRGALSNDTSTINQRTQSYATEAAQMALRLCEEDLRKVGSSTAPVIFTTSPEIQPAAASNTTMAWQTKANWVGNTAIARTLTQTMLTSTSSSMQASKLPQCLAEYSPDGGGTTIIVLTARGFSPDYAEDSNQKLTAGSVVWLQSRFVLSAI